MRRNQGFRAACSWLTDALMLTAIIRSNGRYEPLAATLAALIAAVSEGIVGHAVVVAPADDADKAKLAEETGADFVVASPSDCWSAGAVAARGQWLLLLDAGDIPDEDWARRAERHLLLASRRPALLPLAGLATGLRERLAGLVAPRAVGAGLITRRDAVIAGRLPASARRLRTRRRRVEI